MLPNIESDILYIFIGKIYCHNFPDFFPIDRQRVLYRAQKFAVCFPHIYPIFLCFIDNVDIAGTYRTV